MSTTTTLEIPVTTDDLAWFDKQAISDGYDNARDYFSALIRSYAQQQQMPVVKHEENEPDAIGVNSLIATLAAKSEAISDSMTPLTDSLTGVLSEDAISDNWRDDYVKHILEKHA